MILPGPSQPIEGSFEQIRNFDKSNDNVGKSPYTKRKLVRMGSFKKSVNDPVSIGSTPHLPIKPIISDEIVVIEDHFQNSVASVNSEANEEFYNVNADDFSRESRNQSDDDFTKIYIPTSI